MISIVVSLALGAPVYMGARRYADRVDLDRPGALEQIARQDPQRYERIQGVIQAAQVQPCQTLPGILRTQFRAELEQCSGYSILTSYPAKIHVTFSLDDILYVTDVPQPGIKGRAWPAQDVEPAPGK